jgi:hypothetical protein
MAHVQKPDFVFRRNERVHLNLRRRQFSRLLAAEVCASAVVMLDTPNSEVVKGTGYPLHSPVSTSLPFTPPSPRVTVCHHISTGINITFMLIKCTLNNKLLLHTNICLYVIIICSPIVCFLTMLYYRALNVWMVNDSIGKNETRNARVLFAVLYQHMPGRTEKGHDKSSVGVTDLRNGDFNTRFSA